LWLLGSLALTYIGFSAASVAYQAWGADIGENSGLRTRLTAAREGFGLLGVVLAAALPALIASNLVDGVGRLAWILPPLLLLAALVTFSRVGAGVAVRAPLAPLLPSLRRVLSDQPFRRLLAVFVANGIAAALPATLFPLFCRRCPASRIGEWPLAGALLRLRCRQPAAVGENCRAARKGFRLGLRHGLSIAAFAGASLLGSGDLLPFAIICLASGLALGADLTLPAAIAADIGERQGQAGACFGVWNFIAKLNLALAAGLSLPLLGFLGYVPGGAAGLSALIFAYALLPLAFKALAGFLLWRWRHSLEI
jgi:GPH family glycoside/pentoside/hexuronide:cation symporter